MEMCRLCLGLDLQIGYTFSPLEGTYKDMVQVLLPELNLKLTKDPGICGTCLDNLQKLHDFKSTCLETENKLTNLCGIYGITSNNQISLRSILELALSEMDTDLEFVKVKSEVFEDESVRTPMKSANESEIVDATLKQEEIYIKSEPGTAPETELRMTDKTVKNLHGVLEDVSKMDTDSQMVKVKSEVIEDESVGTTMKYASGLEIIGDAEIKQEKMDEKSEPELETSHEKMDPQPGPSGLLSFKEKLTKLKNEAQQKRVLKTREKYEQANRLQRDNYARKKTKTHNDVPDAKATQKDSIKSTKDIERRSIDFKNTVNMQKLTNTGFCVQSTDNGEGKLKIGLQIKLEKTKESEEKSQSKTKKWLTTEEQRLKDREKKRKQREKIRQNKELHEKYKEKERQRNQKRRVEGKFKKISEMSKPEQIRQRKQWRSTSAIYRQKPNI